MNKYHNMQRWSGVLIKLALICCAVAFLALAARAYHSEQLLVLAEGGRKTVKDYDELLIASIKANPWNGPAHLRKADLLLSRGKFSESIQVLEQSSPGKYHWQGWERLGAARERMAYEETGTEFDSALASNSYDKVLRVHPNYERGLERRAVLALKAGEWPVVEKLAGQLQELDANNQNVIYMRARAADARGNVALAAQLFGQLSSRNSHTTGALFTREEVLSHLRKVAGQSL